ncbi:MAG: DEAD/DEAH box helicase [Pirellulales bacterium]
MTMSDETLSTPIEATESVVGETTTTFGDLNLSSVLLDTLQQAGYVTPTPIQAQAIPPLLAGRDVLGQAQTGTGKTAAFALPLLQRIELTDRRPQILVLTPTRELAIQVSAAFQRYGAGLEGLRVATIYGGQDYGVQFRALDRGAHVVVGTPGRVMDHMRRESLRLDGLRALVLDEADEMLRMGFAEDVEWVVTQAPRERQTALFSATLPEPIRVLAQQQLREPAEITIAQKTATADTIRQRYVVVQPQQKETLLLRLLEAEEIEGVLVFVKLKSSTEPLAELLTAAGQRAAALHGDIPQAQRERIIRALKDGRLDVVVATDVAARGLDVQRISHVINYDLPIDNEAYVHRIGRTGRAGRQGTAILLVTPREQGRLRRLERAIGQPLEPQDPPSNRTINKRRVARFHDRITAALARPEIEVFQSIVAQYVREYPAAQERVAAALAILTHGDQPLLLTEELLPARFEPRQRGVDGRPERRRGASAGRYEETGAAPASARRFRGQRQTYRVEVGRRHQVSPGALVGAIANETGLDGASIGRIAIYDDFSIVDLPARLPYAVLRALRHVRVAGRRLQPTPADEAPRREKHRAPRHVQPVQVRSNSHDESAPPLPSP